MAHKLLTQTRSITNRGFTWNATNLIGHSNVSCQANYKSSNVQNPCLLCH